MKTLLYRGVFGNYTESPLARMRCHRMFAGDECYSSHCRPNREGQSVGQKFYKCKKCNKVMSHQKKPEDHMCGEKMCWNCEDFVDPNKHRYYMKPIAKQEEDSRDA